MSTICGVFAVLAIAILIGSRFGPSYGDYNCCTGRALQSAEEEAKKKAAAQADAIAPATGHDEKV
ncbi:MAG: hypothetical protein LBV76_01100 [Deltaproteobacteria bacterium]|jgi:hypothetical protein|nr:hypothetical protein [Deltaproteobacteria bacterium]